MEPAVEPVVDLPVEPAVEPEGVLFNVCGILTNVMYLTDQTVVLTRLVYSCLFQRPFNPLCTYLVSAGHSAHNNLAVRGPYQA